MTPNHLDGKFLSSNFNSPNRSRANSEVKHSRDILISPTNDLFDRGALFMAVENTRLDQDELVRELTMKTRGLELIFENHEREPRLQPANYSTPGA